MCVFNFLTPLVAVAWIVRGAYWLVFRPTVPVRVRGPFWPDDIELRDNAVAFVGGNLLALGVVLALLLVTNGLFDSLSLTEFRATGNIHDSDLPVGFMGLLFLGFVGVPYMLIVMLIAVEINKLQEPPRKG